MRGTLSFGKSTLECHTDHYSTLFSTQDRTSISDISMHSNLGKKFLVPNSSNSDEEDTKCSPSLDTNSMTECYFRDPQRPGLK